jgi:bifunctional non-homologous end joining protein LigD
MLAKICRSPFSHDDWLFEVKWDGIRCLLHLEDGEVRLQARSLRELTRTYPELLEPEAFKARQAVVDGEIVALDREGKASFNLLQNRMNIHSERNVRSAMERIPVTYYAFDLLCRDGVGLMRTPLRERKKALRQTIVESDAIKYSDHVERDGEEFYAAARNMGIEGVMAKKRTASTSPG